MKRWVNKRTQYGAIDSIDDRASERIGMVVGAADADIQHISA